MTASLYLRLGGAQGLAAVIDDIVDRHAANPLLAPRFRYKDLPQLKALSQDFFSARAAGGTAAEGSGGYLAHAGMQFGGRELAAVIDDIVAAMQERGLADAEIRGVIKVLGISDKRMETGNVRGTQLA